MRVLIISFDRTLTEGLKQALSDHEVFTAKNSEEAIKMIPSDMDVVIYDAISGAISEEDINTLHTKKFSNSKYLILYDELFPVDPNNIVVPKKILIRRDEDPKVIVQKMFEEPEEVAVGKTEEQKTEGEVGEPKHEVPQTDKVLVVSFDQTLIDTVRDVLGPGIEMVSVKTVRQAIEEGKDASVVVFDAISGIIAEKGLVDMSKDEVMSQKPYVILVDDLFPINVDNIPLSKKFPISRTADPSQIKDTILKALQGTPKVVEEVKEEKVEEIVERELPEEVPEIEIESVETKEEEEAPALQALESVMEEKGWKEEVSEEAVKEAVSESLSEERIREIVSKVVEEKLEDIKATLTEAIRSKVDQAFEEVDVKEIIREVAYKALKERLDELVT